MERKNDLDFAKGIGIILMVLGHCFSDGNGQEVRTWFYSFHMPLFFVIPGLLSRDQADLPYVSYYIKKRTRALLIPYCIWGIAAALFLAVMGRRDRSWLLGALKSVLMLEGLSAMWFLPCLLLAELLFWCCRSIDRKHPIMGKLAAIVLALTGGAIPATNPFTVVILRSFTGASFICLGWALADLLNYSCKNGIWVLLVVLQAVLAMINGKIDVLNREYGNPVLFYLNALMGCWLVIRLYHVMMSVRWRYAVNVVTFFGRNSLIVVCTSLFAIELLRLTDYKLFGGILPELGNWEGFLLCSLAMGMEAIAIVFCRKYLWFTFGKSSRHHW